MPLHSLIIRLLSVSFILTNVQRRINVNSSSLGTRGKNSSMNILVIKILILVVIS